MIYLRSVVHGLVVTQNVIVKPQRLSIENRMTFGQTITHNIRTRKLTSNLGQVGSVTYRRSIVNLSVSHTLNFQQILSKNPIYVQVNDLLFHWQTIQRPKTESVISLANIAQTVNGQGAKGVPTTLQFGQTIVGNCVRSRNVTTETGIISGVTGWVSDPNFNYLNPVFSTVAKVRFKYNDFELYIRKPDFDDTYTYDFTRISRRSRGGDLIISRDSIWPAVQSFNIHFSTLSQEEVNLLLYFFKLTLGKKCRYLNYDNMEWEGFITNPQAEVQQNGRKDFSVTIEFDGGPYVVPPTIQSIHHVDSFNQTIAAIGTYNKFIAQLEMFSQGVSRNITSNRILSQSEIFSQSIVNRTTFPRVVSQSETFSQTIVGNGNYNRTVSETETFNQIIGRNVTYNRSFNDSNLFVQSIDTTGVLSNITNQNPGFSQTIDIIGTYNKTINQSETFSQTIIGNGNYGRTISETETFSQIIVNNTNFVRSSSNTTTFTQNVINAGVFPRTISETEIFSQIIATSGIFNRTVSQTETFSQTISYVYTPVATGNHILQENSDKLLLEDGSYLLLES